MSEVSVGHSVVTTINKRYGIAYKAIFEIKMVIDDTRSSVPGAFVLATNIWEMAVIPALLNSSDCWIDMPKEAIDKLDKIQNKFYQVLLNCPSTCPKPGLYWFTGGLLMQNRIIEKKLLLLFHLLHLDKDSLAYEVLDEQRKLETCFWNECLGFLRELDIPLHEVEDLSKHQWKSRLREAIRSKNRSDLLTLIEPYKKLNYHELKNEECKTKEYFHDLTLSQAQVAFAIDTKMLRTVKSDFPSNKEYEDDLWRCQQCTRTDSIRHLTRCPFFSDLRINKNLKTNTEDIVEYFQEIIKIRLEF